MDTVIRKELILEGLDCAHCATKIEAKVNEINGVNSASMNFVNKTLTIETDNAEKLDEIFTHTKNIVNGLEPHVIVREKAISKPEKKVLLLTGLCCANCAAKIENGTRSLKGVKSASLDFVSRKLTIEANNRHDLNVVIEEVKKIVKRVEPDVNVIIEEDKAAKSSAGNAQGKMDESNNREAIRLVIGSVLFGTAFIFKFSFWPEFILYFISYLLVGGEVLLKAVKNIVRGQVFDENFLMCIATIGAFSIKQFPEGVAVMLFYQIGEFFQDMAVNRSRKSIADLMDIRPDYANVLIDNDTKRVDPDDVNVGDIIVVKPGEKIPLDGIIVEGKSLLNTSALTGESIPREVETGDEVLAGFINKNGLLNIKVTKGFGESTVSKILDLVQNASSRKAPTENFITKFARYYTPGVVFTALALAVIPPLMVPGATFSSWIYRALVFLVVSCPCALVVSIPLGFFGGIGGASKNGILIKGSNYLEALNSVETVIFDKTGTLTKGVFRVTEVRSEGQLNENELLRLAAYAESYSNHPIATSILNAYGKVVNKEEITDYDEISGLGMKVKVNGKEILAGNIKLMGREKITFKDIDTIGTVIHIAIEKKYAGYIVISDEIKEDSKEAIKALKGMGKKTIMLTGDNKSVGTKVAEQLGIDEVYAELLPDQKVEKLEMIDKMKTPKGKIVFVGDGINDAPVLARADIGIAMGGIGSDAAIEAADVVIMTDEPSKIVGAIKVAKRTKDIVWQNIIFAFGVKVVVLLMGAGGLATMWEAVFADVGVALIAVLNAMRVMKVRNL